MADWVRLEQPSAGRVQPAGPRGRPTCLNSTVTSSFPSSSCLTSWGISKTQGSPPIPQVPSSLLPSCFAVPENLSVQRASPVLPPAAPPPHPGTTFSASGLPHFPVPNCLLPQIFRFPGQLGPGPWVWWSEPCLAGSVALASPAAFLCAGQATLGLDSVHSPIPHVGTSDLRVSMGSRRTTFHILGPVRWSPQTPTGGSGWAQPGRSNLPG